MEILEQLKMSFRRIAFVVLMVCFAGTAGAAPIHAAAWYADPVGSGHGVRILLPNRSATFSIAMAGRRLVRTAISCCARLGSRAGAQQSIRPRGAQRGMYAPTAGFG